MNIREKIEELKFSIRSGGNLKIIAAVAAVVVLLPVIFIMPLVFPGSPVPRSVNYSLGVVYLCTLIAGIMILAGNSTSHRDEDPEDAFLAAWFLSIMGVLLFWLYHLVVAVKISATGDPKAGFFFLGKTNQDMVLNAMLVISMIGGFLGAPVMMMFYIKKRMLRPRFYSVMFGILAGYCLVNITEIVNYIVKWLDK